MAEPNRRCLVAVRGGCCTAASVFDAADEQDRNEASRSLAEHLNGRSLVEHASVEEAKATYGDHFLCNGRHGTEEAHRG